MQMPHLNLSPVTMAETFGHYLLIRLQVVPEVAFVLEYYQSVAEPLLEAIEAHKDSRLVRRTAMARRDYENHRMDKETRVLAFTILGVANNNRSSPLFRHYFPNGFSEVVNTPLIYQRRRSVVLLEKLEAERNEIVRGRLEPFRTQLRALESALSEVVAAQDDEARHRANREAAKLEWLDGYRRTYQMLQEHYSSDPREAESFFHKVRSRKGKPHEDDLDFESDLEYSSDIEGDAEFEDDPEVGESGGAPNGERVAETIKGLDAALDEMPPTIEAQTEDR